MMSDQKKLHSTIGSGELPRKRAARHDTCIKVHTTAKAECSPPSQGLYAIYWKTKLRRKLTGPADAEINFRCVSIVRLHKSKDVEGLATRSQK